MKRVSGYAKVALLIALAVVSGGALMPYAADSSVDRGGLHGIGAFYREGQTFVTWTELADVEGETYRVYRSDRPISARNLLDAALIATVPEGSCWFEHEMKKSMLEMKTGIKGYGQRFCIVDNPENDPKKMLPEGTGLLVHTVHRGGAAYYAVVPEVGGRPRVDRMMSLAAPVAEKVAMPGAVIQWRHPKGSALVYTHWMDHTEWKPLKEGYAYNFSIAMPENYDGAEQMPVMFYGHGMGGGYRATDSANYWRCIWVRHGDESGSWFFGMMNRDKTKVVNYVEQRVRWSWKWLKSGRANQPFRVDPTRVQAHGQSMGGTMCTAFALRLGDIFSSTVSSAGATIHRRNKTWVKQAEALWGSVAENLPGPDGVGVWDHQDYAQWSMRNIEKETAFLLISNGKRDSCVVYEPFPDLIDALQKSKRPFAAHWDMRGHTWRPYSTRNEGMGRYQIRTNESLPALANASNNGDPRKDNSGTVNGNIEWSASGNDFDKTSKADDIVDTPAKYAINLRSLTGPTTADVTPRRLQAFEVEPGGSYAWSNTDFSDPARPRLVDRGVVKADKYGLITVTAFKIGKPGLGNRLTIIPTR
jgi:prolyl oligopeptidase family protein